MRQLVASALCATVFALAGCYPESGVSSTAQLSTATTFYDKKYDFGSARTYAMPDSVVHITEGAPDTVSHQYDQVILNTIASEMNAAGYSRADNTDADDPDLVVLPAAMGTTNIVWWNYPWCDYWGWYWPGYCPGWTPGYPGWTTGYTYQTGTVLILMVNRKGKDDISQTLPAVWLGAINGVIENPTNTSQGIVAGIQQLFTQSPYLKAK